MSSQPPSSMLSRARGLAAQESGLTLLELLIVMAIVGALAAVAIATFRTQQDKATDAKAKAQLMSAQRAMETFFIDNGTYLGSNTSPPPDPGSLVTIEPALVQPPVPTITRRGARSYTMQVVSTAEIPVTYELRRRTTGTMRRTCSPVSTGGCPSSGAW